MIMIEAVAKVCRLPRCIPSEPEREGYHWVRRFRGGPAIPLHWNPTWWHNADRGWGMWGQPDREGEWEYLGPCPSPDDTQTTSVNDHDYAMMSAEELARLNAGGLLPCPFCGPKGVPRLAEFSRPLQSKRYRVVCDTCGSKPLPEHFEEYAIKAWNTRHPALTSVNEHDHTARIRRLENAQSRRRPLRVLRRSPLGV